MFLPYSMAIINIRNSIYYNIRLNSPKTKLSAKGELFAHKLAEL